MKGRDHTMKKMDRVDRTVFGTVGSCILKRICLLLQQYCITTFNNRQAIIRSGVMADIHPIR